jgi:hypothetical protein
MHTDPLGFAVFAFAVLNGISKRVTNHSRTCRPLQKDNHETFANFRRAQVDETDSGFKPF